MAWGRSAGSIDDLKAKLTDPNNKSLYILSFRKFNSSQAKEFARELESNNSLEEFYASGHSIDAEAAEAFGNALKVNSTLKLLCLGGSNFGDEPLIKLCQGLVHNSTLKMLDLEHKNISDRGMEALASVLTSEKSTLSTIKLTRNQLTPKSINILAQALARNMNKPESVQNLVLCNIDADAATLKNLVSQVANAISTRRIDTHQSHCNDDHNGLKTLDLSDNTISSTVSDDNPSALSVVGAIQTLRCLSLRNCGLGIPELEMFIGSLPEENTSYLEELDLSGNVVQPQSDDERNQLDRLMSTLLERCPRLVRLQLAGCHIGDAAIQSIGRALRVHSHKHLQHLDLTSCSCETSGVAELIIAITLPFCTLSSLCLFGNPIGDNGAILIANDLIRGLAESLQMSVTEALVDTNSQVSLRHLDLGATKLTQMGVDALFDALKDVAFNIPAGGVLESLVLASNSDVSDAYLHDEVSKLSKDHGVKTRVIYRTSDAPGQQGSA